MKTKVKTLALTRGAVVITSVSLLILFAFFLSLGNVHAASADYFLKLDGVEGESTNSTTRTQTVEVQTTQTGNTSATPGVEPDEIDVTDDGEEEARKGNVEYGWKVEEGESAEEAENDRLRNAGPVDGWPDGGVSVSAREIRGWDEDEKASFLLDVKAFAELQSSQDLENFARGILLEDEDVERIEFRNQGLEVAYRVTGKLFGVIPISFTERVVVQGENGVEPEIDVTLPWYGFLINPDVSPQDIALEAKIKHQEKIEIESWSWGVSQTGTLIETLVEILKSKHDTVKNSIGNVR